MSSCFTNNNNFLIIVEFKLNNSIKRLSTYIRIIFLITISNMFIYFIILNITYFNEYNV